MSALRKWVWKRFPGIAHRISLLRHNGWRAMLASFRRRQVAAPAGPATAGARPVESPLDEPEVETTPAAAIEAPASDIIEQLSVGLTFELQSPEFRIREAERPHQPPLEGRRCHLLVQAIQRRGRDDFTAEVSTHLGASDAKILVLPDPDAAPGLITLKQDGPTTWRVTLAPVEPSTGAGGAAPAFQGETLSRVVAAMLAWLGPTEVTSWVDLRCPVLISPRPGLLRVGWMPEELLPVYPSLDGRIDLVVTDSPQVVSTVAKLSKAVRLIAPRGLPPAHVPALDGRRNCHAFVISNLAEFAALAPALEALKSAGQPVELVTARGFDGHHSPAWRALIASGSAAWHGYDQDEELLALYEGCGKVVLATALTRADASSFHLRQASLAALAGAPVDCLGADEPYPSEAAPPTLGALCREFVSRPGQDAPHEG